MLKSAEIRRQAAQRLRELFPRARGWEESTDVRLGNQTADLLVRFKLGEHEQTMVVDVTPLGQPRQIRAAVTKLADARRALPAAYPVAASVYIGPQSARILKDNNLGFVDLSGNSYLAFEHVLIDRRPASATSGPPRARCARCSRRAPRAWCGRSWPSPDGPGGSRSSAGRPRSASGTRTTW